DARVVVVAQVEVQALGELLAVLDSSLVEFPLPDFIAHEADFLTLVVRLARPVAVVLFAGRDDSVILVVNKRQLDAVLGGPLAVPTDAPDFWRPRLGNGQEFISPLFNPAPLV